MGVQVVGGNQGVPAVAPVEGSSLQAFCNVVKNFALSIIHAIGDILGKIFSCFSDRAEPDVQAQIPVVENAAVENEEPPAPKDHLALPDPQPAPLVHEGPVVEYFLPKAQGDVASIQWDGRIITVLQLYDAISVSEAVEFGFEKVEKFLNRSAIPADELRQVRSDLSKLFSVCLGNLFEISNLERTNSVFARYNPEDTILQNQKSGFVDTPVRNLVELFSDMEKILDRAPFNQAQKSIQFLSLNLNRFVEFDRKLEARQKHLETPKGMAEAAAHRLKDKVKAAPVGSSLLGAGAAGLLWAVAFGNPIGLAVGAVAAGVQAHRRGYIPWPNQQRDEKPVAGPHNLGSVEAEQQDVSVDRKVAAALENRAPVEYVPVQPHKFQV